MHCTKSLLFAGLFFLLGTSPLAHATTLISAQGAAEVLARHPRWLSIVMIDGGITQDTGRSWQVSQKGNSTYLIEESHSRIALKEGITCEDLKNGVPNPLAQALQALPQHIDWNDTQTYTRFWKISHPCSIFEEPVLGAPQIQLTEKNTLRIIADRYTVFLMPLAPPKTPLRMINPGEKPPLPLFLAPQGFGFEMSLYSILQQLTPHPVVHRVSENPQQWIYPKDIAPHLLKAFQDGIAIWENAFPQLKWAQGEAVTFPLEKDTCLSEGHTCLEVNALSTLDSDKTYTCTALTGADPLSGEFLGAYISCQASPNLLPQLGRKKKTVTLQQIRTRDAMKILDAYVGKTSPTLSPEDQVQVQANLTTQILIHELGHTYGLAHNFAGSLRKNGEYSSAMDYYTGAAISLDDRFPGVFFADIAALNFVYFGLYPESEIESCTDVDLLSQPSAREKVRCLRYDIDDPVSWTLSLWNQLRDLYPLETVRQYFSFKVGADPTDLAKWILESQSSLSVFQKETLEDMQRTSVASQ